MRLLLSGGGSPEKTRKIDEFFVSLLSYKKKVLFIPVAKVDRSAEDSYSWMKKILADVGFNGELQMWTSFSGKTMKDMVEFGAVLIGGGNTFNLLKEFSSSRFSKVLKNYVKEGLVYGISAGAMIFCPDINFAPLMGDTNNVSLKDTSALNLIKDIYIWPHYRVVHDKLIINLLKERKIKVIALPEGTGIYLNNKILIVKGTGTVVVFQKDKKDEYMDGEKIQDLFG